MARQLIVELLHIVRRMLEDMASLLHQAAEALRVSEEARENEVRPAPNEPSASREARPAPASSEEEPRPAPSEEEVRPAPTEPSASREARPAPAPSEEEVRPAPTEPSASREARAAPAPSEEGARPAPAPTEEPLPAASEARQASNEAGPALTKKRCWAVVRHEDETKLGIYFKYTTYAEAVRDRDVPWTSREPIPFMRGSFSKSYWILEQAEEFFRHETGLREISYFKN